MWNLPGSGLESVSPALAGGFLTTAPPEKHSIGPGAWIFKQKGSETCLKAQVQKQLPNTQVERAELSEEWLATLPQSDTVVRGWGSVCVR